MGGQSHWALPPGKKSPAMVEQFVRTNSPRAQSNKVGSASNTIPCFPTSNDTDVHHCDTIPNRSLPSHFTKDSPSNLIFPKSERGELSYINSILVVIHVNKQVIKNLCQCLLGKSKRTLFEK